MEKLLLPIVIEKDADGYFAYCPQLQGCYTQGDTYGEALENIRDAIGVHIEDRLADGESLPELEAISMTAVEIPSSDVPECTIMSKQKSIHEPGAQLLSAQDAIQDAERLQALLLRNRQRAEREVQLRVPFTVIIEAVDQLEADELRLLAQRLEERLAGMQR
jgi:predicted RNase H-like HicB family nuclease